MGPLAEELAGLRERLAQTETALELLHQLVGDLLHSGRARGAPPRSRDPAGTPDPGEGGPLFASVEDWVRGHLAVVYPRAVTPTARWCPRWWDHAEAICRLEALWRTWEAARLDPLRGMADWYRDLDPQLAVLSSPAGPFAQCTPDRHAAPSPLPLLPAPAGHWHHNALAPGAAVCGPHPGTWRSEHMDGPWLLPTEAGPGGPDE